MSTKLYETAEDLRRESDVIAFYAAQKNCDYQKLPIAYKADYALLRGGELKAFAEIKCRKVAHDKYDTIILSLLKWHDINALAQRVKVPAMLVVRYTDGVYTIPMREVPDSIEIGGRVDRGDDRDVEPVVHYRVERMRQVSGFRT